MDKFKKMVLNQHCFVLLLVKGKRKEVLGKEDKPMDNRQTQSCRCSDLDRELAEVLMEISGTAEQAARHLMILRAQRKSKGVKAYDKRKTY